MQENRANLDFDQVLFQQNLEEIQGLLEDQHLSSLQHVHQEVNHLINSEALSSVDSLEAGEHDEIYETLTKAPSFSTKWNSISHDYQSPQSRNQSCFGSDGMTLSKMRHVNNWLTNLGDKNTQAATPFDAILIKPSVLTPSEHLNHQEKNSPAPTGSGQRLTADTASSGNGLGTFKQDKNKEKNSEPSTTWKAGSLSSGMFKRERPYFTVSPTFQSRKPSTALTSPTHEAVQISDYEENTELTQRRRIVAHASNPPTTPLIVSGGQWSDCTDTYNSTCSISSLRKNVHIQGTHAMQCANYLGYKDEKVQDFEGTEQEETFSVPDSPSASSVFNKSNQPEKKEQNDIGMAVSPSSRTSLSDLVEQHRKMNHSTHERNGVCLLKSILKKESKYENNYFKALLINQGICFGNQTAASIRDSVELTKVKGKGSEGQKASKKLRWFDEISKRGTEDEDRGSKKNQTGITQVLLSPCCVSTEVSAANNTRSSPCGTLNPASNETPKDDPLNIPKIASIKESEKDRVPLNSLVPSGYHFAKQAWLASKSAAGKLSVSAEEAKSPKTSPRRGKPKVIRRARCAKGPSAFASKSRKGTVIRPQSARDANKVIQTQGKILIPHPPLQLTSNSRMGKNAMDSQCQPVKCSEPQKNASHPYLHSKWDSSPKHVVTLGIQESSPSLWNNTCTSDLATVMPFRPSSSISEGKILAKTNHTTTSALQVARGSPVYEESCPKLDHTPTEEEIAILWKGVNSALAQNENTTGDLQQRDGAYYNNSYLTNLPASEPSLSGVNIHGSTTLNNLKLNSTKNGTLSSPSSESTVTRRKQNLDSGDSKHRGFAEQRRETSSSKGTKCSDRGQNSEHTVKLSPLRCDFEPVQTSRVISNAEEVSESTAQFLLAENLVKSSAPEDEILIAMETMQPHKPTTTLNKTRQLNINALSFEEQKILQSLDCLNQRLQDVQGIICKNPSIKSILQLASPLKSQPWTTSLPMDHRISTYSRSRLQRKY
ncbi:centrosomal protein of 126 kDa isoform X2 [Tachyglossus aculeatus]|nr:centrosomal protein of 126 kDa isoform X2 [Tachyglossus aculeatus]